MRVGVISEGRSDFAVLRNLIRGTLDLSSEIISLRPDLQTDTTDEHSFSNWEHVQRECAGFGGQCAASCCQPPTGQAPTACRFTAIQDFLNLPLAEEPLLVVHIDAAERALYGVAFPPCQNADDVERCFWEVVLHLYAWMRETDWVRVVPAVAVEETEAWLLTLYEKRPSQETGVHPGPKERLKKELQRTTRFSDKERKKILSDGNAVRKNDELSKDLRKPRELQRLLPRSASLRLFVTALGHTAENLEPGVCRL